jgi:hypothetical protein
METTRKDLLSALTEKPAVAVISDWPGHVPHGKYVLELSDSMVLASLVIRQTRIPLRVFEQA